MKLLARYPNGTKLVDTGIEDNNGNSCYLCYENGELLFLEKISGVVYINETVFEIYSGPQHEKTGLFTIGIGVDWNAIQIQSETVGRIL